MNASADEKMGLLLLSGWIMLQDCCPTCNCPLFSSKDRKTIKCAVCPPPEKETNAPGSPETSFLCKSLEVTKENLSEKMKKISQDLRYSHDSKNNSELLQELSSYAEVLDKLISISIKIKEMKNEK